MENIAKPAVPLIEPASFRLAHPLQNVALTALLTLISFTIFGYFWQEKGFSMLIVGMGWPHVILGFAFFFGRVLRDDPAARKNFLVLIPLTVALWVLHYWVDITYVVYVYFLFHAFRDEVTIFLQSAEKRAAVSVYAIRGLLPLMLLMMVTSQPPGFRGDLRRVTFEASSVNANGWTLIAFDPVLESAGRSFYFYLLPSSRGPSEGYLTAVSPDSGGTAALPADEYLHTKRLDAVPYYAGDQAPADRPDTPLAQFGGNVKPGNVVIADRNGLSGFWVYTSVVAGAPPGAEFIARLASPPMMPFESAIGTIRTVLIWLLAAWFLLRVFPTLLSFRKLWIFVTVLAALLVVSQQIIKPLDRYGYLVPMLFQTIVVYHYFSWYVFSYRKFFEMKKTPPPAVAGASAYDRLLAMLRQPGAFTVAVAVLNLISFAGVAWYYQGAAPAGMRFGFDYTYFLYFLIFHVTFSFAPFAAKRVLVPSKQS